jgi:YHS domain-containing protein
MARLEPNNVINAFCPWSGKPVRADSRARYRGHVVGFCNRGCRDKFQRATDQFDAALQTLARNAGADN